MLRDIKQQPQVPHIQQAIDSLKKVGPPLEVSSPWLLFGGIFLVASVGGIAALMRG